ncbi:DUF2169 domain-containing protein [Chitiniphilus purpureus]|uniref:DUF2169 domain-containing protein n=1 Tax=Chitiniphilus purpureus TaxID=2981137 RepID=A0ABY6DS92_9NEIS|nr:DUF2169 domain-containing protein [Chitiniphilus sp. CD1]UXY17245.1 DUF2169 domain-containing protein [Chitiniphilus sp. CD1]
MKIVKPLTLGVLHRPYAIGARQRFAVTALGFFRLGADNPRFLPENLQWPLALPALPPLQPLDEAWPKPRAEVLLGGAAFAPAGIPVARMAVRLACAGVDKTLAVLGERDWYYGLVPWFNIGEPAPFARMPLGWERAFGGPDHPGNPLGRGYRPNPVAGFIGQNRGAMPNLEYPGQPVRGHGRRLEPAGFGPLDVRWAPRSKQTGTYKARWLEREAPGLASDIDPEFFMRAPLDQRLPAYLQGGEAYRLEGLHPGQAVIEGGLPSLTVRAFVQRVGQEPGQAEEVPLACDTVWFFPEHLLGLMVWHGDVANADADGLDIAAVMVGYEAAHDRRALEHYRQVLALRTDLATAALHALDESQLAASYTPTVAAQHAVQDAAERAADQARRQAVLDEMDAEFWAESGLPRPADHQPPRAPEPVLPSPSKRQLADSDFDLVALERAARSLAAQAEAMHAELAAAQTELPPAPAPDPLAEREAVYARASMPAADLVRDREPPVDADSAALAGALEAAIAAGAPLSPEQVAQARAAQAGVAAQRRAARRAAPQPTVAPLPPESSAWLGGLVREWLRGGAVLAGRDLAGIDLSGADLSGADLREVLFEHAHLSGTDFRGADLRGAVFTAATLEGADFSGARLDGANFSASRGGAVFRQASLRQVTALQAVWHGADLTGATLQGCIAAGIDLSGARLDGAVVADALLTQAKAEGSRWRGAQLNKAVLLQAQLAGADFAGASLVKVVLLDAVLAGSAWQGATLDGCALGGKADWQGARLGGINAARCGWHGANLAGADFTGARVIGCELGECDLADATLADAVFARSLLMRARLARANALRADFFQALLRGADLRGADLRGANLVQADCSGALVEGARFDGVRLEANRRVA